MVRLAVVIASTRPGRVGASVAQWVQEIARERSDAEFELVDLADFALPLLDEPEAAAMSADYTRDHTVAWSNAVGRFDGYVFVIPEYNHSVPASWKNAVDFLYDEWRDKAAGFVGYGTQGGQRAVEHARSVMTEVGVANVRDQVAISLFDDLDEDGNVAPRTFHVATLGRLLDQVVAWSVALRSLRRTRSVERTG